MSNQIYRFSAYKGKHHFTGEFAASKAEIKWITGKKILLASSDGTLMRVTIRPAHFSVIISDKYPEDVQKWMETTTLVGICPFNRLDEQQHEEYVKHFRGSSTH